MGISLIPPSLTARYQFKEWNPHHTSRLLLAPHLLDLGGQILVLLDQRWRQAGECRRNARLERGQLVLQRLDGLGPAHQMIDRAGIDSCRGVARL
jgi:hypothetical protein